MNVDNDCATIRRALAQFDYYVSEEEARIAWEAYSNHVNKDWATLGNDIEVANNGVLGLAISGLIINAFSENEPDA